MASFDTGSTGSTLGVYAESHWDLGRRSSWRNRTALRCTNQPSSTTLKGRPRFRCTSRRTFPSARPGLLCRWTLKHTLSGACREHHRELKEVVWAPDWRGMEGHLYSGEWRWSLDSQPHGTTTRPSVLRVFWRKGSSSVHGAGRRGPARGPEASATAFGAGSSFGSRCAKRLRGVPDDSGAAWARGQHESSGGPHCTQTESC